MKNEKWKEENGFLYFCDSSNNSLGQTKIPTLFTILKIFIGQQAFELHPIYATTNNSLIESIHQQYNRTLHINVFPTQFSACILLILLFLSFSTRFFFVLFSLSTCFILFYITKGSTNVSLAYQVRQEK